MATTSPRPGSRGPTTPRQVRMSPPSVAPRLRSTPAATPSLRMDGPRPGRSNARPMSLRSSRAAMRSNFGTWLPAAADGSSGGFTSYNYTQPWYQAGIVPTTLSERNVAIDGPVPMRVEPDLSLDADPATGFLIGADRGLPERDEQVWNHSLRGYEPGLSDTGRHRGRRRPGRGRGGRIPQPDHLPPQPSDR